MNAKKAKKLRKIAREAKIEQEDKYLINTRTRTIRLGRCAKGLYGVLKKMAKALPAQKAAA